MSDVVHGEPRREGCTCPPDIDVMRGRGGETRPECPRHPEDLGRFEGLIAEPEWRDHQAASRLTAETRAVLADFRRRP